MLPRQPVGRLGMFSTQSHTHPYPHQERDQQPTPKRNLSSLPIQSQSISPDAECNDSCKALEIPFDQVKLGKFLAKGAFGFVYEAEWKEKKVAVKRLTDEQEYKHEARIMIGLDHQNIVKLLAITLKRQLEVQHYYLVMELMEGGDLRTYLLSEEKISWELRKEIAKDILRALAFLHNQTPSVLHRDLKSSNILLTKTKQAKIADFGMSRFDTDRVKDKNIGTISWRAPELLKKGASYSKEADVYSAGVILWQLLARVTPFKGKDLQYIEECTSQGKRDPIPTNYPLSFQQIIKRCWDLNPTNRPTAMQAMQSLEEKIEPSFAFSRVMGI
jgi:serine/threonine protein kinase